MLHARDDDPAGLARQLWDLTAWARTAERLLKDMATASDTPGRFVAAAGMVRHLLTDPVLPDELLPPDWPATNYAAPTAASPPSSPRGVIPSWPRSRISDDVKTRQPAIGDH